MKKTRKILAMVVICVIAVSLLAPIASANPSSYWCGTHKQTYCSHCLSHTMQNVATATASCTEGSGTVRVCMVSGCNSIFYQNAPPGHQYNLSGAAKTMCTRYTSCGYLKDETSSTFQHYMYRTTSLTNSADNRRANNVSREHPTPGLSIPGTSGSENGALDITTGTAGVIQGYEIYAQGLGTVTDWGDNLNDSRGNFVEITYNLNGTDHKVRYMHFDEKPSVSKDNYVGVATQIGKTGTSGTTSTGYHLHIDVKVGSTFERTRDHFPSGTFRN